MIDRLRLPVFCIACLFSAALTAQPELPDQNMANAAAYAEAMGGAAVLIMQNDSIVYAAYHNGADTSVVTHIFSATKAFWAIAAAAALESGLIDSYEERVSATITEWQNPQVHPFKNAIRIKHLLSLSSGLSQDVAYIQGLDAAAPDIYQYVIDSLDLNFAPSNAFQYGPSHYYAFGLLLERKLQQAGLSQNPLEYLDSLIFEPIGLEYGDWAHDASGNPHIPNGCYINPREWVKFGQLLLHKGNWQGTQLVDSIFVEDLLVADGPNLGHGKFLWLNTNGGHGAYPIQSAPPGSPGGFMYHDGYTEIIGALGAGKNRMYIIPSLHLIAIRQTSGDTGDFSDHAFLSHLLEGVAVSVAAAPLREAVMVYPNPAGTEVWVEAPAGYDQATVINASGRVMAHYTLRDNHRIDLSNWPAGVYFIQLSGGPVPITRKLVKRQ